MRAMRFVWRWRRNPLRRRSDVVEAWAGVAAVVLMLVLGTAAGWAVGSFAHGALREAVRQQQQHRHLVSAEVVRSVTGTPAEPDHESTTGREGYGRFLARWQDPDGVEHTGLVALHQAPGPADRFPLWTDDEGRIAGRPMDRATAVVHAVLAGAAAAAGAAGLVEGVRRVVVWRLVHRRYAQWDREWQQAGHTWGRADAGS
ncbi:hypothetical protein GCM10010359_01530 [Streptomyces morookaense]|nr:hypothetical protein GCM10010359_01530 [Streptomyces morookaense]